MLNSMSLQFLISTIKTEFRFWYYFLLVCFFFLLKSLIFPIVIMYGLTWWLSGKESPTNVGNEVQSLYWEDLLEEEMATHSSILAWEIPWTEAHSPWSHKSQM